MKTAKSKRAIMLVLVAASLAIYAFHSSSLIVYAYDDAFISFRYAENLANGHGLVYNVGERVEGYTNFLWTVILAGAIKLGRDPLIVAKALGILFALATMALTVFFSAFVTGQEGWRSVLPMLFLACSGPFVAWAQWGLEGGMFTFFALLGLFLFLRALRTGASFAFSSILFLVAAMTRPEGTIFFAVCLAYYLLLVHRAKKLKAGSDQLERGDAAANAAGNAAANAARPIDLANLVHPDQLPIRLTQLIAPFAVVYAFYYGWRFSYYGYPYPNTYYVRMAGSIGAYFDQWARGLKYIFDFAWRGGGVVIVILIGLLWIAYRPTRRSMLSFLSVFCLIPIGYSMHVGGDSKHLYRLLMPYLPILYILAGHSLSGVFHLAVKTKTSERMRRLATAVFATFVGLLMLYTYYFPTLLYFSGGQRGFPGWELLRGRTAAYEAVLGYERQKRLVGEWLRRHAAKSTTIATTVAGVTPYYSKLHTYDMLGVTDVHIAHTEPQPHRIVSVDLKASGLHRPDGIVENILITSHLKSDNEYIIRQNPTLVLEGYDIAFRNAGYKRFRLPTEEFTQYYFARQEVEFVP